MFVRNKQNKSSKVSVQVVEKDRSRRQLVVKTVDCSGDPAEVERMMAEGREYVERSKDLTIPGMDEEQEKLCKIVNDATE